MKLIRLKIVFSKCVLQESSIGFEQNLPSSPNLANVSCYRESDATDLFGHDHPKYNETSPSDSKSSSIATNDVNNNFNVLNDKNANNAHNRYRKVYHDGTEKTGNFTNTFLTSNIKRNDRSNELKINLKYKQNKNRYDSKMGSNVSRDATKRLSQRRTQSSG